MLLVLLLFPWILSPGRLIILSFPPLLPSLPPFCPPEPFLSLSFAMHISISIFIYLMQAFRAILYPNNDAKLPANSDSLRQPSILELENRTVYISPLSASCR